MKKALLLFNVFAFMASSLNAQSPQIKRKCGSADVYKYMMQNDAAFRQNQINLEQFTKDFVASGGKGTFRNSQVLLSIPVVVHVLYNTAAQNISDEQIKTQIDVLNEDFNNLNYDQNKIHPRYRDINGNMQIRFELARQDPSGNPTTGITRTSTAKTFFCTVVDDAKFNSTGGKDIWNRNVYLNLWVVPGIAPGNSCNASSISVLGYAQFPGGTANTDGVVIGYEYFGRPSTGAPYSLGRTATHEVGHWLNLRHIWGDDSNQNGTCTIGSECSGSDQVTDTPNACDENFGSTSCYTKDCPTTPINGEMFYNYMDYTDDGAMYGFTAGQVTRSAALFASGLAQRGSLLTSIGASNVAASPANDAGIYDVISPERTTVSSITTSFSCEVILKNYGTVPLTSCDINYWVDTQAPTTYSWNGNLAPGAVANVVLPSQLTINGGLRYFYASTSNPNGTSDGTTINDRIQRRFYNHTTTQSLPLTQNFDAVSFLNVTTLWQNKNFHCGSSA